MTYDEAMQLRTFNLNGNLLEVLQVAIDTDYMLLEYLPVTHDAEEKLAGQRIFYAVPCAGNRILGAVTLRRSDKGFTPQVQEQFKTWLRELPEIDQRISQELENFGNLVREVNSTNGKELTDEDFTFIRDFFGSDIV